MKHYHNCASPLGEWVAVEENETLLGLFFPGTAPKELHFQPTALLLETERQLSAYATGRLREFSLPYGLGSLSPHKKAFYELLERIPYGEVWSYGQVGKLLGTNRPYPARAVGRLCHGNPLPLVLPCHRVCGKDGSLKGYAGGLPLKQQLLDLEQGIFPEN